MYSDPSGHSIIATIIVALIGVVATAATAQDIYHIATDTKVDKATSENVHIVNSDNIITPWVRYVYGIYLNHFNAETKDVIQGSTAGFQYEWELHNYAAWFGFGGKNAKHLDVGASIFSDGKLHPLYNEGDLSVIGIASLGMRLSYAYFGNPVFVIWDLIANGGF